MLTHFWTLQAKRGGGGGHSPEALLMTSASSLALQALQVLISWNIESVQSENDAAEKKPSAAHVYVPSCRSMVGADKAVLHISRAFMTAQAANKDAKARGLYSYIHMDDSLCTYDTDGCITVTLSIADGAPRNKVHTVTKQRVYGVIPSSAPLDIATARALHVAASAPRTVANALLVNSQRLDATLFAVVNHYRRAGEHCGCLRSVWPSRAEAKQEAKRLTADEEWRRMRRLIRRGYYELGWWPPTPGSCSADSGDSDGEEGAYMDQHTDYDCHHVCDVKLRS
eukprot:TRINITY_DN14052_c0_g1_i1.p1 TRINITY_DN14052_c0_g1~~TRINITY_DN14052_c0_g1_i1.p1  ORF type:complete len:283 (-),score=37.91 TRINITY_DN14052_c0_g1_i1:202-1050(-)